MTIEQTVEVPIDRRVFFDLPQDFPVGKAKIEVVFTPLTDTVKETDKKKIHLTKNMIDELLQDETLRSLTGILQNDIDADEIRAERLKKYEIVG